MRPDSDPFDVTPLVCPGVFYATHSGDGVLSRIRTPGGMVTSAQCVLVAEIADRFAGGVVTITNRANIQLRALSDRLPPDVLLQLQQAGLAGAEPAVDHLRNVMASPTAGLDASAIFDTRPLVSDLDRFITAHSHLAALPAKFSIGLDGGERASIAGLPNDVLFRSCRALDGAALVRVVVRVGSDDGARIDLGIAVAPDHVVQLAAAIAEAYLALLPADGSKPRLRRLLAGDGLQGFRQEVLSRVSSLVLGEAEPAEPVPTVRPPVGVHAQGGDLTYIGLVPFVAGRLSSAQLRQLAGLAERLGSGSLRLSPWRNVLVPDVPHEFVEVLQSELEAAELACRASSLASGIVACAGSAGCSSGAADTVRDALALSARLATHAPTAQSLNIHLSGCEKCCAQRRPADITLLGRPGAGERYDLFVRGDGDAPRGRLLYEAVTPAEALTLVEGLVADPSVRR